MYRFSQRALQLDVQGRHTHTLQPSENSLGRELSAVVVSDVTRHAAHRLQSSHTFKHVVALELPSHVDHQALTRLLGDVEAIAQRVDPFTLPMRAQEFPDATSCSIDLSRTTKATSFFSRAFSCSRSLNRLA